MKIQIGSRAYDVQNDRALGFVVMHKGRVVTRGCRVFETVVAEFKRLADEATEATRVGAILRGAEG